VDDQRSDDGADRVLRPPAPRTTRDGAPVTTRDGAPVTTRDGAPVTTRDGAPGTTRDAAPARHARPSGRYQRVNLPPELADRFATERDLGSGGEADLLLVRERSTGEPAVVRIYRHEGLAVDSTKLDRLRHADRRYLIGLLDWGRGDGCTWEVLEYAAAGSLEDLRQARPGPWAPSAVWEVLSELLPAVEYSHSLNMVHRDIKPANVLVRSTAPLDLVLADFGLATFLAATREMRHTRSRTSAYAAPEAATGDTSAALDWWSLGIVLVELLTGRHPFQRPDGSWMDDVMIVRELTVHDIDVSGVADEHWRLLCRGLLTRAPEDRWGSAEVRRWCTGDTPSIAQPRGPAFVFADAAYTDPRSLADAMRNRWSDARRLLAGQQMAAPQFLAFRDWAGEWELTSVLRVLSQPTRLDRAVTQVILALDPHGPVTFCQRPMDHENLIALAAEAIGGPGPARGVVDLLYRDGILAVLDGRPGCEGYGLLDSRWRRLVEGFETRTRQLRLPLSPEERPMYLAMLLTAAFPGQEELYAQEVASAGANPDAQAQPWFCQLVAEHIPTESLPAHHATVLLAASLAEEKRRREVGRRKSMDDASAVLGIVCGLLGCLPLLGIVTGPAAFYFGYRARRGNHRTASTWCYVLGVLTLLNVLCSAPAALSNLGA